MFSLLIFTHFVLCTDSVFPDGKVWLFLRTWEKLFFPPSFLGEDKPVEPVLDGNVVKTGTLLLFMASGRKVTATQL